MEYVLHKVSITAEAVFDYEHSLLQRRYPRFNYFFEQEIDTAELKSKIRAFNLENWTEEEQYESSPVKLQQQEIKAELEEYLQWSKKNQKQYFRINHYDEQFDRMLMLFVKRAEKVSVIQNWIVVGMCLADDWTQEDEDEGRIRNWYNSRIENLQDNDWVEEERLRREAEEKERQKDEKEIKKYERLFT
jgi:hypothetical protein